MLGEYGAARERYEEALPLFRRIGDQLGEAKCIGSLGNVYLRLGATETARNMYSEALSIFGEIGDRLGQLCQ
jgi:tetratricopeptide (TPR) repeat protein